MDVVHRLVKFRNTRLGNLVFGTVELGAACMLSGLAINSGSLWEWALVVIFIFGGLHHLFHMIVGDKK